MSDKTKFHITAEMTADQVAVAIAIDNTAFINTLDLPAQIDAWQRMLKVAQMGQAVSELSDDSSRAANFWMAQWVIQNHIRTLQQGVANAH